MVNGFKMCNTPMHFFVMGFSIVYGVSMGVLWGFYGGFMGFLWCIFFYWFVMAGNLLFEVNL